MIGSLLCLYCGSGCQASIVASSLAFHPPSPSYDINLVTDTDKNDSKDDSKDDTKGDQTTTKPIYSISFLRDPPNIDVEAGAHIYKNPSVHIVHHIPSFSSSSSTIPLLYFKSAGAQFTLIYSHGNATDLGAMFSVLLGISVHMKMNVVGYDYSGYGPRLQGNKAHIQTTEQLTYNDIDAVYKWLIDSKLVKIPAEEVIVYGQSVGSGPSCYLASTQPVAGLVLHSAIMSGLRVLTPSRLLCCFDIFPNIDRIKQVHCPVLVIHGQVWCCC